MGQNFACLIFMVEATHENLSPVKIGPSTVAVMDPQKVATPCSKEHTTILLNTYKGVPHASYLSSELLSTSFYYTGYDELKVGSSER